MAIKIDAPDPRLYNDVYRRHLTNQRQLQIFFGGASSGKSLFVLGQRTILDLLMGGRNFLICRNVGRTNRDSTFNEMRKGIDRMGLAAEFTINKTDLTITCGNGYQAVFKGMDDIEKIKSFTPHYGSLTDVIIEEATETRRDDVRQLRKRMRGPSEKTKRMTLLFNPIFKSHWIYQDFFAGHWDDVRTEYMDDRMSILKTTYKNNKFLAEDEIYDLEHEGDSYTYDVYTLGNWGMLGDVIFTNWRIEDLTEVRNSYDHYRNGLDFGYASDPAALCRSTVKGNTIYITHEAYQRGLVNRALADLIRPIVRQDVVKCDSSEPKSISELQSEGINAVACKKGRDSVMFGIQWLQGKSIVVHSELQNMINELTVGQWKKDKYGETLPQPVDKNNHLIDALRYSYDDEMNHHEIQVGQTPF